LLKSDYQLVGNVRLLYCHAIFFFLYFPFLVAKVTVPIIDTPGKKEKKLHLIIAILFVQVNFLSQVRLSHKGDGPKVARRLVDVYFALFKVMLWFSSWYFFTMFLQFLSAGLHFQ